MVFNNDIISNYGSHFNIDSLSDKLTRFGSAIGKAIIAKALTLYYVLISYDVPLDVRIMIVGALGYLILPADLIPDWIAVLGFADDAAAILFVFDRIEKYRTVEIDSKVENKLKEIL